MYEPRKHKASPSKPTQHIGRGRYLPRPSQDVVKMTFHVRAQQVGAVGDRVFLRSSKAMTPYMEGDVLSSI